MSRFWLQKILNDLKKRKEAYEKYSKSLEAEAINDVILKLKNTYFEWESENDN